MSGITVSNTDDEYNVATITFPTDEGPGSAWLTVDLNNGRPKFSVNIVRTDEGMVVDVYPEGQEDGGPVASTYAFDEEGGGGEESGTVVRFTPEAWQNDYAVEVDPEGDVEWRVTPGTAESVAATVKIGSTDLDFVKYDTNAPRWIKEWSGPFTITVVEQEDV
jgi:hypothetical protein